MQIKLKAWIDATSHASKNGRYRHQSLRENLEKRSGILVDLKTYIQEAHSDARLFFEGPTSHSLDPLEDDGNESLTPFNTALRHEISYQWVRFSRLVISSRVIPTHGSSSASGAVFFPL